MPRKLFRCTFREANDFFHKEVEETAKSNNKRSPPCHKCAQQQEIDYILLMISSTVPKNFRTVHIIGQNLVR